MLPCPTYAHSSDDSIAIRLTRPLKCHYSFDSSRSVCVSSVQISSRHFVTSNHVLSQMSGATTYDANCTTAPIALVPLSQVHLADTLVLTSINEDPEYPGCPPTTIPNDGDPCKIVHIDNITGIPRVTTSRFVRIERRHFPRLDQFVIEERTGSGSSGSPVWSQDNRLVGFLASSTGTGYTYVTPAETVLSAVKSNSWRIINKDSFDLVDGTSLTLYMRGLQYTSSRQYDLAAKDFADLVRRGSLIDAAAEMLLYTTRASSNTKLFYDSIHAAACLNEAQRASVIAMALTDENRSAEASDTWSRVPLDSPLPPHLAVDRAVVRARSSISLSHLHLLMSLVDKYPNDPDLLTFVADYGVDCRVPEVARRLLAQASIASESRSLSYMIADMRVRAISGDAAGVEQVALSMIVERRSDPWAYDLLTNVYRQAGRFAEADMVQRTKRIRTERQ